MKCPSCGTENPEGSRFCMSCAAPLSAPATPSPPGPAPSAPAATPPPPPMRRQPHEDLLGLLGLAFFLIAVAVVFALNPNLVTDLSLWSKHVSASNTIFIRPPEGIIGSLAVFFGVFGVLEFISASLRWALGWTPLRTTARVLAGVGDLSLAALLILYAGRSVNGTFLLTLFVGILGVLLVLYITLGIYWASARAVPRPEAASPPARQ